MHNSTDVREALLNIELEKDKVKELELWEQQNTNAELNSYAANLQVKIRSKVCKKDNDSPRLNHENLNLIKKDPDFANTYGFQREKYQVREFKEAVG